MDSPEFVEEPKYEAPALIWQGQLGSLTGGSVTADAYDHYTCTDGSYNPS